MDAMYHAARVAGVLGGKVTGAGGGGYMLFVREFDKKHRVAEALKARGAQIVNFAFYAGSLHAWEAD